MRQLAFILLFFVATTLPVHSSDDGLTAEELAHHLGISAWVSKVNLQGETLIFQLFHVVNGQIVGTSLIGTAAFPTDREFTRVAILASRVQGETHLSIKPAAGPAVSLQATSIPLISTIPLPTIITVGEYVLGGDLSLTNVTQYNLAKVVDVKNGLLLRVTRRPETSAK